MNHSITVLSLKSGGTHSWWRKRRVTVQVDGTELLGTLHFRQRCSPTGSLRFYYTLKFDDKKATEHKDWKEIRKEIILQCHKINPTINLEIAGCLKEAGKK